MNKRGISRRDFVRAVAAAGVAGAAAGLIAPWPARAKSGANPSSGVVQALEDVLGYGVSGVEKNHRIPARLATVLSRIGADNRGLAEARRQILLRAAGDVEKRRRKDDREARNVTRNLNDLLDAVRVLPSSSRLLNPLIGGMVTTVLFSTHGVHFSDTRHAHRQARNAMRDVKKSSGGILTSLILRKQALQRTYREVIGQRVEQVSYGGHFPEDITIRSVWLMSRSRKGNGSQRAG